MNSLKYTLIACTVVTGMVITSCKKGCTDPSASNFNESAKQDDGSCAYTLGYSVPETYKFTDANGYSTVSITGQQQRMEMLSEMVTYLKTANTRGNEVMASNLKNMFANTDYSWTDENQLELNSSTKQLRNKCAGGDETIIAMFEQYMDSVAEISSYNRVGTAGTAGVYENDGIKGPYLMDANGVEYTQWIEKGLMGAVFYYQMTEHYLGDDGMNVSNVAPVDFDNGKYYTEMEHHWDEAFGYFTSEIDYPTGGTDRFYGKYAAEMEDLLGSQTKISEAFRTGRAAIVNSDMTTRDEQRQIIKDEMERMIAGTAIHYLNEALANITANTTRNHVLSEATAFIDALRYGANGISGLNINSTKVDKWINTIGGDFNNVSTSDLQSVRDELSTAFDMDNIKMEL